MINFLTIDYSVRARVLTTIVFFFHVIGFVGIALLHDPFFTRFGIINLLIVFSMFLMAYWNQRWRFILAASIIVVVTYTAEWLGVNYGLIFGDYHYNSGLGDKIFGVPVFVAFYWMPVAFGAVAVAEKITNHRLLVHFVAGVMAVIFDFLLEPFAYTFEYWHWVGRQVPPSNYIAWGAIIFILSVIIRLIRLKSEDFAQNFFLIQLAFLFMMLFNL